MQSVCLSLSPSLPLSLTPALTLYLSIRTCIVDVCNISIYNGCFREVSQISQFSQKHQKHQRSDKMGGSVPTPLFAQIFGVFGVFGFSLCFLQILYKLTIPMLVQR